MLGPGDLVDAASLVLRHERVPGEQVVAGEPSTGLVELGRVGELAVGVWEMTPGAMSDTEADEVFVVITGHGRIDFVETPGEGSGHAPIDLATGAVVRLTAGMRTVWTVEKTVRKIWVA
ncbi:cupin [Intrasporangium oryzae NRRL B-24470]|uniref:Cupin n=1 Tax=Intrasporangium oryzae NRRL B-24470 TaxID=1386089 RepID=W9GAJ6_9MICO|nr:cupin [Intrasporangium oryzae NRRL B-24470]